MLILSEAGEQALNESRSVVDEAMDKLLSLEDVLDVSAESIRDSGVVRGVIERHVITAQEFLDDGLVPVVNRKPRFLFLVGSDRSGEYRPICSFELIRGARRRLELAGFSRVVEAGEDRWQLLLDRALAMDGENFWSTASVVSVFDIINAFVTLVVVEDQRNSRRIYQLRLDLASDYRGAASRVDSDTVRAQVMDVLEKRRRSGEKV